MGREKPSSPRTGEAVRKRRKVSDGAGDAVAGTQVNVNRASKGATSERKLENVDLGWIKAIPECPVFKPTEEEFGDPLVYLQKIAPVASQYGICKVICPLSASVPAGAVLMKEKKQFKFTSTVQPLRLAKRRTGDKNMFQMSGKNYTFKDFEKKANEAFSRKYSAAACLPAKYIEEEFWRETACGKKKTEYASDIEGSAFSSSLADQLGNSKWNLKALTQMPTSTLRLLEYEIAGITEPMLYIGMLFSMFAWHVEDQYLYSVNYNHCGSSKTWYGVPAHAAHDFEKIIGEHIFKQKNLSSNEHGAKFDALLGKTTMFPPDILLQNNVPVYKTEHRPGEFIFTFPRAYHAGFSHGFNCAEAVNFALGDWFPIGSVASDRYAFLKRCPYLPYEELLCKEAMLLSACKDPLDSSADSHSQNCIKSSFVHLMRFHHYKRWLLLKSKPGLKVSRNSEQTIFCSICNRDSYVSHIKCNECMDHICLHHEINERGCSCNQGQVLSIRKDILEMESVSKMVEQEDEEVKEVYQRSIDPHIRPSWLLHSEDDYVPYCDIKEEPAQSSEHVAPSKCMALTS